MGRPTGAKNLSDAERRRIRQLYREGVRVAEIAKATGRGIAVVGRLVKPLTRKRPPATPSNQKGKRNDRILELVERGLSRAEVAERVGLSPSQVGYVVAHHPRVAWLLRRRNARVAVIAQRFRIELSTALRIASGSRRRVKRTRSDWHA
jgi:transposase